MEKNVWWQAIQLFYKDYFYGIYADDEKILPSSFYHFLFCLISSVALLLFLGPYYHSNVLEAGHFYDTSTLPGMFLTLPLWARILVIGLGFNWVPFWIPLVIYGLYFLVTKSVPCLIVETGKYFSDLFFRAKKEVINIQEKEEKEKIEKIKNCYKTLIEYWTSRLAEPEKLKIGEKEEIEESIARTLRLENLSLDEFGMIILNHSDSISEDLSVPRLDQLEKVESEIANHQTLPIHE